MAKKTNLASSAIEQTTVQDFLTSGTTKPILNQTRWEDFQDLTMYCNTGSKTMDTSAQPLGEELNTPLITAQDEFYFGGLRSSGDGIHLYDDSEPWGTQDDNKNTSQTDLWSDVSNWLSTSPRDIDDEENNKAVIDIEEVDDNDLYIVDGKPQQLEFPQLQQQQQQQYLINSGKDILLSQSAGYNQPNPSLVNKMLREEPQVDLQLGILSSSPTDLEPLCVQSNVKQHTSLKSIGNNMVHAANFSAINNIKHSYKNRNITTVQINSSSKKERINNLPEPSRSYLKSTFRNRRDLESSGKNNLSRIIKSEEPLIGVSNKLMTSCTDLSNINMNRPTINPVKVTEIVIAPESIATTSVGSNNIKLQTNYINSFSDKSCSNMCKPIVNRVCDDLSSKFIIPEMVKTEPADNMEVDVSVIEAEDIDSTSRKSFKLPGGKNIKKPCLRLDIDSAAKLVTTVGTPTTTPTIASISANCDMTNTPDVLRPLLSGTGFNLLSYIIGDGTGDDLNSPSESSTSDVPTIIADAKKNVRSAKPVKNSEKTAVIVDKCDSLFELRSLPVVKEEEVMTEESSFDMTNCSFSSMNDEKVTPRRTPVKRKRIPKRSDDMESDLSNLSDFIDDDEKNDATYIPTKSCIGRKRTISRSSTDCSRSVERLTHYGKRRKQSRETDSSDHESVTSSSTNDKYRELRNRNNEASRRSRLNRKSREIEMKEHALKLEEDNRRLKAKADEMEKLVNKLRVSLLNLVKRNPLN